MEHLDSIERKLNKLRNLNLIMVSEDKESSEIFVFKESFDLIVNQIDINLDEIDEACVNHAHGVYISARV